MPNTSININHARAEEVILAAYRTKCKKNDDITSGIRKVLTGTHKTYKYILINGILAKASNSSANPISLQAGAPLKGAFDARCLCHKVNQSGASSKEIGDIDIYQGKALDCAIEVKDKKFNEYDVEHALGKIIDSGGQKAAFIYGFRGKFEEASVLRKIQLYEKRGLCVVFQDITTHIKNILFRLPFCTRQEFIDCIIETSKLVNCKDETKEWMFQIFSELQWKS